MAKSALWLWRGGLVCCVVSTSDTVSVLLHSAPVAAVLVVLGGIVEACGYRDPWSRLSQSFGTAVTTPSLLISDNLADAVASDEEFATAARWADEVFATTYVRLLPRPSPSLSRAAGGGESTTCVLSWMVFLCLCGVRGGASMTCVSCPG